MASPITAQMEEVLEAAWRSGIFSKSNLARSAINQVLEAAQRGWITTELSPSVYGNVIQITPSGLMTLNHHRNSKG